MQFIGALVRDARLRRNMTQRQLAWASTLTQSTISKLETGRLRGMRLRTLAAIMGVLRTGRARADAGGRRIAGHRGADALADRSDIVEGASSVV
jgi:transcriptional regulator with XRE-family HTH domain